MSKATYTMICVTGSTVLQRKVEGAPQDARMFAWAKRKKASFVARFFPSKRGWVVTDVREAMTVSKTGEHGTYHEWLGAHRLPKVYATEEAAVMVMVHRSNAPKQTSLAL